MTSAVTSTETQPSPTRTLTPAWIVAVVASVLGLGVAIYLTIEHYTGSTTLACSATGAFNCHKVTTSSYSVVAGVPVALAGLIFFVVLLGLLALPARLPLVSLARLVVVVIGILTVFWLVYVELFRVDAICPWCTAVHAMTFIAFVAVLWDRVAAPAA